MGDSTKQYMVYVVVAIIVIAIIVVIAFLAMYFTSTGLFKTSTATFKSGFNSRQSLSSMEPLVQLAAKVDNMINRYDTQLNIDIRDAYDTFNNFLALNDKNIPIAVIEGATQIKELIVRSGQSLSRPSNELNKFLYELKTFRSLLNEIFNSSFLLSSKVGGKDKYLDKITDQRIASNLDNVTRQWIDTMAIKDDEHDLREIAVDSLSGVDREIGSADSYTEFCRDNKDFVGNALPASMTLGKNGKIPQFPYRGAKFNRGNIPDVDFNEIPPNEQKDRPYGNRAGLINHIERDTDVYNPFIEAGITR
jgi:uncharacterized protein (UPF0333 family)